MLRPKMSMHPLLVERVKQSLLKKSRNHQLKKQTRTYKTIFYELKDNLLLGGLLGSLEKGPRISDVTSTPKCLKSQFLMEVSSRKWAGLKTTST